MNNFFEEAIGTLETLVKAINGHEGNKCPKHNNQFNAYSNYKNTQDFNRKRYMTKRRKCLPCNR